jgi:hypothetical protein
MDKVHKPITTQPINVVQGNIVIGFYFEVHKRHTDALLWAECSCLNVKSGGRYSNH